MAIPEILDFLEIPKLRKHFGLVVRGEHVIPNSVFNVFPCNLCFINLHEYFVVENPGIFLSYFSRSREILEFKKKYLFVYLVYTNYRQITHELHKKYAF